MNCKSWVANLSVCGGDGLLKSFDSGSKGKSKSYYTFRLFLHDRWVWVFHEEFSDLINAQIWQTLWHHTPFIDAWDHQMWARLDKTNWWLKFFFLFVDRNEGVGVYYIRGIPWGHWYHFQLLLLKPLMSFFSLFPTLTRRKLFS